MTKRQPIPLITDARTVVAGHAVTYHNEPEPKRQKPLRHRIDGKPLDPPSPRPDALDQVFARAREVIQRLEGVECLDPIWSPSQHCRRAA